MDPRAVGEVGQPREEREELRQLRVSDKTLDQQPTGGQARRTRRLFVVDDVPQELPRPIALFGGLEDLGRGETELGALCRRGRDAARLG